LSTIGELSDISVTDLIDIFTRRGRTGRLVVKAGGQEVHLYFEDGRILLISSTDITIRLGRMLIRQGLLDTQRLLEALHLQSEAGSKRPLGQMLLDRDWVTRADLTRCVEEQSIEALARAISAEPGLFVFEAGVSRPAYVEPVPLDPSILLRAAQERTEALRVLRDQLPQPGTPLSINTSNPESSGAIDDLGAPEAMIVTVLRTGPKSYGELSYHVALDELTLGVAVLTLIERKLLLAGTNKLTSNGRVPE
jgi:hypothetical protein